MVIAAIKEHVADKVIHPAVAKEHVAGKEVHLVVDKGRAEASDIFCLFHYVCA